MDAIRRCVSNIDSKKAFELALGILGINISFLILGIIYQNITTIKYTNSKTGALQNFRSGAGFIMIERGSNWLMAEVYKYIFIPKEKRISIPWKNSAITAFTIYVSTVAQTQAMFLVSYGLVIMAKSCSLINVILVGVCCSRVRSKQLKLGANKIIIAVIVSVGIICFRLFDPKGDFQNNKKTQLIGLVLLLSSLFADGFTPDFQAQIKQKYKPEPIVMLIEINKWITFICAIHLIVTGEIFNLFLFFYEHPQCTVDMCWISLFSFLGQIFVYRMIRQFKQHIVPFVVTTRKILTVGLSIIYFQHQTNFAQISSIIIVFSTTCYEFYDSITKTNQVQANLIQMEEKENSIPNKDQFKSFSNGFQLTSSQQVVPDQQISKTQQMESR